MRKNFKSQTLNQFCCEKANSMKPEALSYVEAKSWKLNLSSLGYKPKAESSSFVMQLSRSDCYGAISILVNFFWPTKTKLFLQQIAFGKPVKVGSYAQVFSDKVSSTAHEIVTNVTSLDYDAKTPPDVIPLWIVVISACLGALILMALIYLLYRVSIFDNCYSKYCGLWQV